MVKAKDCHIQCKVVYRSICNVKGAQMCFLEAHTATSRDVMKLKGAIVVYVLLLSVWKANVSCTHL